MFRFSEMFCIIELNIPVSNVQILRHVLNNKQKYDCKMCSDPIKVTINNLLKGSRQSDRKYNRYDADRFIDKCFLKGIIEDYPTCYYEDSKTPPPAVHRIPI